MTPGGGKYIRLGVDLLDHPKALGLDGLSFSLYVGGMAYAARHLTDGFIPTKAVRMSLIPSTWWLDADQDPTRDLPTNDQRATKGRRAIRHLTTSGLWERVDGGYQIHNYLAWQRSRSQVENDREKTRKRVARHRAGEGGNA